MFVGEWDRPYTRAEAVYVAGTSQDKCWLPVQRVDQSHRGDQSYGDRNLICSCPPPEAFTS